MARTRENETSKAERTGSREDIKGHMTYVGDLIRRSRVGRFTLEELAQRANVSSGLISQLERGRGNPSMVTLLRLADALSLPIGAFFQEIPPSEDRVVVRKHQRRTLDLPHEGLSYELLTPDFRRSLAMLISRIPQGFENRDRPFVHPGEECLHVLSGKLEVAIGDQCYSLAAGDSITYDSGLPHWFSAITAVELIGAFSQPPRN